MPSLQYLHRKYPCANLERNRRSSSCYSEVTEATSFHITMVSLTHVFLSVYKRMRLHPDIGSPPIISACASIRDNAVNAFYRVSAVFWKSISRSFQESSRGLFQEFSRNLQGAYQEVFWTIRLMPIYLSWCITSYMITWHRFLLWQCSKNDFKIYFQ